MPEKEVPWGTMLLVHDADSDMVDVYVLREGLKAFAVPSEKPPQAIQETKSQQPNSTGLQSVAKRVKQFGPGLALSRIFEHVEKWLP